MNNTSINRNQLIDLSNAAYQIGNLDFARKLLISWLKEYPHDLWIRYRLAIVLYKSGKINEAIRLSEIIVRYDPEFIEVWALLAVLYPDGSEDKKTAANRVKTLRSFEKSDKSTLKQGISNLFNPKTSAKSFEDIEDIDDFDIIAAIRVARNISQQEDTNSYFRLMKIYTRRWPKVIQFKLLLGNVLNQTGSVEEGTKLIHSTLADDLTAQVANRIWKNQNPYQTLWLDLDSLSIDLSRLPVPQKVAKKARLDKSVNFTYEEQAATADVRTTIANDVYSNQQIYDGNIQSTQGPAVSFPNAQGAEILTELPDAMQENESSEPSPLESKQAINPGCSSPLFKIFGRLFGKQFDRRDTLDSIHEFVYKLDVNDADDRFPVYVVCSTIAGLTTKYGKNNKDFIDQEMRSVADAIENREGWNAMVFYPDEFQSSGKSLLDPQAIRNALIQLDQSLAQKGSMIGALLLVGGHDVVPFFTLSNPAMDDDLTIHSDAPYGSHEPARFFDQQWQVGRIPGDNTNDPGLLLSQLRTIQNYHISKLERERTGARKKSLKPNLRINLAKAKTSNKSFGYCASVWQRPSVAVYRNLSDGSDLLTSPATMSSNFPSSRLEAQDYGYFNLHGIKGQPNWYGQKDSRDTSPIPTIPIALEMQNVQRVNHTPKVVFAENCYGAEIINRSESNAFSLHMLGKGTRVFIGSTAIAYGAMNLPLTAADLFGYLYWKHLMTGISCGEAFRRARKNLAAETEAGSGALDGEIQKTLVSFVFFGDPLYAVMDDADITDRMQRAKTPKSYGIIRERMDSKVAIDTDLAKRIYKEVKEMYELQGVSDEYSTYVIQKQIPVMKNGENAEKIALNQNYVIVYTKDTKMGNLLDRLITRVTVSKDGKIKKVSFSR